MRRLVALTICWFALVGVGNAWAKVGAVTGTIAPVQWAPEVKVCVAASEDCVAPRSDGSFQLELPEGEYAIEFVPSFRSRLLKQYYNRKPTLREANPVKVEGEKVTPGVDASLIEGGAITGLVTSEAEGLPLGKVEVCAIQLGVNPAKACTTTAEGGEYELHSLPAGQYRVGFWGVGPTAEYEPSYYRNQSSMAQGTPIAVNAGLTTDEIDAAMTKGGTVRGVVSSAATAGFLSGVPVCLFAVAEEKPERCTYSDAVGGYSFVGLPSGAYQVGFSLGEPELGGAGTLGEDEFEPQYFHGVATRAQATTIPIFAPAAVMSGVDAALSTHPALAPPLRLPPASTPPVTVPTVAVPTPRKAMTCRKPKRKQKVKGKVRCVARSKKSHTGRRRHGKGRSSRSRGKQR